MAMEGKKLKDIFEDIWNIYEYLEKSDDPTPSASIQVTDL